VTSGKVDPGFLPLVVEQAQLHALGHLGEDEKFVPAPS
jgi:hypothetical protein